MSHLVVRQRTFNLNVMVQHCILVQLVRKQARIYLHILPGNFTFKPGRLLLKDLHIMERLGELDMRGYENRIQNFHQPGVKSRTAYKDHALRSI